MEKVLLWGTGIDFKRNLFLIKYYEMCKMEIVGITSKDAYYDRILTYRFINKKDIDAIKFDYLIIVAEDELFRTIQNEAIELGINEGKIIPIKAMQLPNFEFQKYSILKKECPTIFAPNCWGGVTYNSLALPFKSPFINMFLNQDDYLKFLKNPKQYLDYELEFVEKRYETNLKIDYPVAKCGDILLHLNHYKEFDYALDCWNRRKKRINWDNIIVMYSDEDEGRVHEFLNLPYRNKVCFVSFPYQHKDVISIEYKKECPEIPFFEIVNGAGKGNKLYYDTFELLLNHNIVPLVSIK